MSNAFSWLGVPAGEDQEARDAAAQLDNDRVMQEIENQHREIARMAFGAFITSSDGAGMLDYLRARTIEQPLAIPPDQGLEQPGVPLNPAEWLFIREGQNSVIRHIEGLIRMAREYANKPANQQE